MNNILITGASRGIGRAIALKAAENESRLFLNSLTGGENLSSVKNEIERLRAAGGIAGSVSLVEGDVGDPDEVRRIFGLIENELNGGKIGVLINNAGISHIGLVQDMTDEEWNRIIAVNLSSVHYLSKAVIPHMLALGGGHILNISSVWGNVGSSCEVAYSASKGGVNAYTRALAKELAPSGIAVNAIACGCIDTDMNRHLSGEDRNELCEQIPAGRFARPEEVAELAVSLCNGNNYLTGQVITFDGGWI